MSESKRGSTTAAPRTASVPPGAPGVLSFSYNRFAELLKRLVEEKEE